MVAGTFARIDQLGARFRESQQFFINERIVNDDIRARDQLSSRARSIGPRLRGRRQQDIRCLSSRSQSKQG